MRKATVNYLLAFSMALLALFQALSGFVMWLILPGGGGFRGSRGAWIDGETTFLWDRQTWIDLHEWIAVALLVVVTIHVILHWGWIVRITKGYFKRRE